MHVFVTGATGFIGFHTVMALHKAGHSVRLGIRNPEKMRQLYADTDIDISDYAVGEITDAAAIDKALEGVDAVVHTAAMVSMDANQEKLMRATNLIGTKLVVGGAVKKGIESIVYISSVAAIFDPSATVLNEDTPLIEPKTAYAKSKNECELYIRELMSMGAKIAITYPAAVMGPDDPGLSEPNEGTAFFFKLCFVISSTGQQIIDVRELAEVQVKLLEQKKSGGYLVTGHFIPWRELGFLLDKVTGKKLLKIPVPAPVLKVIGHIVDAIAKIKRLPIPITAEAITYATQWVYADDSKVRKELNIEYRPLEDTMADTVLWLAKAGHINSKWAENINPKQPSENTKAAA
ncbi:MAG: NAD-dependent epimerase/dehydratase family protein [Pseudomonadales bacterium]|nr:NAD-dependent epimerase/dehydratase family protein [Pseudomonadales bacterium]